MQYTLHVGYRQLKGSAYVRMYKMQQVYTHAHVHTHMRLRTMNVTVFYLLSSKKIIHTSVGRNHTKYFENITSK
jgi:hypothetical protein